MAASETATAPVTRHAADPWESGSVVRHNSRHMASTVQVLLVGFHDAEARHAAELADAHIAHLERRWSRFQPHSDITRLNAAGGRPVEVHQDTATLLAAMVEGWRITGGLWDPTMPAELADTGYSHSIVEPERCGLPSAAARAPGDVVDLPDGRRVGFGSRRATPEDIRRDGTTVELPPGLLLDPGGIGKGLAADLVVERLLAEGVPGVLVSIGGDLRVGGTAPDPLGWVIAVDDPHAAPDSHTATDRRAARAANGTDRAEIARFAIDGGGVATSSTCTRRWIHGGRERHHILDPRTRDQAHTDLASCTVVAPTAWQAEVHATAAMLHGATGLVDLIGAGDMSCLAVGADPAAPGLVHTHDLAPSGTGGCRSGAER